MKYWTLSVGSVSFGCKAPAKTFSANITEPYYLPVSSVISKPRSFQAIAKAVEQGSPHPSLSASQVSGLKVCGSRARVERRGTDISTAFGVGGWGPSAERPRGGGAEHIGSADA